jgi:hypothetical protein
MGHKINHIMSSKIEVIRICEHCKKQFTARTTLTRYCSPICNSRGYKALLRNKKVEKSNQETVYLLNTDLEKIMPLEVPHIYGNQCFLEGYDT